MSGSNSRHKLSRNLKEKDAIKSKPRLKFSVHKQHQMESKTPPLPTKSASTLEELLKKRQSLKEELKKIVKYSDNEPKKVTKKRKHSKDHSDFIIKRGHKENEIKANFTSIRKPAHESSPEIYNTQIDSEDEQNIIEHQRKQRKQLLEKFNIPAVKSNDNKMVIHHKTSQDQNVRKEENQKILMKITDMFSEKDEFEGKVDSDKVTQGSNEANLNLTDNWDDPEGYYNVRVGDMILNKYTIKGVLGQGVFANVVRAQDNSDGNDYVAIKIVRNNDLMYRTSLKEIAMLNEIKNADPDNKYHCVQLLGHFMYKGHLCILLESLHMDLRAVIKKYGKHHGINMKALISYSRQLFLALRLLKKLGIVHADIKPDNILVNEKKNILKLCDFGSAAKVDDTEATPYLVSRFYRAPEIILGVAYKHSVDIWSAACTLYEMATGKIMFTGSSNNKMLKCFMDLKGKFPVKLIKKGKFKDQHFNYNNNFLLHKKDEFTGREKFVEIAHINPTRELHYELSKCFKNMSPTEEKKVGQLKDLLDKMTVLDSGQRYSVTDCLIHQFILEDLDKGAIKK